MAIARVAVAASAAANAVAEAAVTVAPSSGLTEVRAAGLNVALGGDDSAPPLVLLHGLAERWQVFERLLPLLAPRLRTVAIDLPGFGASPPQPGGGFDLGAVCARVEAVVAELGLEQPAMLGHSLGGGLAVRYASERPGALSALVLLAPAGLVATGAVRPSWRRPWLHAAGRTLLRAAIPLVASDTFRERAFARVVGDPAALDAELARELAQGAAHGRATPAAGIEIVHAGLRDRLDALKLPTLVIWGGRDRVVSPGYAQPLRDALPDGRLLLLPEAGHVPMCEQPDAVATAVFDLLCSS
jgi:pimeloyl-ACP methyl ester carboxylesterase